MTEKLEFAAMIVDGFTFTGGTPCQAGKQIMLQAASVEEGLRMMLEARGGYLTSTGRFVELEEAAGIAEQAGQCLLFGTLVPEAIAIGSASRFACVRDIGFALPSAEPRSRVGTH
jgi:hypothetical protein